MNKKFIIILLILSCTLILITACSSSHPPLDNDGFEQKMVQRNQAPQQNLWVKPACFPLKVITFQIFS